MTMLGEPLFNRSVSRLRRNSFCCFVLFYIVYWTVLLIVSSSNLFVFGDFCPPGLHIYGNHCMECPEGQYGQNCLPCSNRTFGPNCSLDCHCVSACNPVNGSCLQPHLGCEYNYNGSDYTCQLSYLPARHNEAYAHGSKVISYNSTYKYFKEGPQAIDRNFSSSSVALTEELNTTVNSRYVTFRTPYENATSIKRIRLVHLYLSPDPVYAKHRWGLSLYIGIQPSLAAALGISNRQYCYLIEDPPNQNISFISDQCRFDVPAVGMYVDKVAFPNNTPPSHWGYNMRGDSVQIAVVELETFVCSPGTWGKRCEYTCPLKCKDSYCNLNTGECDEGCQKLWAGTYCNHLGMIELSIQDQNNVTAEELLDIYISVTSLSCTEELNINMDGIPFCNVNNGNWTASDDIVNAGIKDIADFAYYANYSRVIKINMRFEKPGSHVLEFIDPNMTHIVTPVSNIFVNYRRYQECMTLKSITYTGSNISNAGILRRHNEIRLEIGFYWNLSCPPDIMIRHYNWTVTYPSTQCWITQNEGITLPQSVSMNKQVLVIPPFFLDYEIYEVGVTVHGFIAQEEIFRFTKGYIKIELSPIKAVLEGSSIRNLPWSDKLVLNASSSYDPDQINKNSQNFNYSWSCITVEGNVCYFNQTLPPSTNQYSLPFTDPVLNFTGRTLAMGVSYVFSVTASVQGRENSTASQIIGILYDAAPDLVIRCLDNCGEKLNVDETLILIANDLSGHAWQSLTYTWAVATGYNYSYIPSHILAANTSGGIHQKEIIIHADFVVPGKLYYIRVEGTSYTKITGFSNYVTVANKAPSGGRCYISPVAGLAIMTNFEVRCEEFMDEDYPLTYKLLHVHLDGSEALLHSGIDSVIPNILLPVGKGVNNTVALKVHIADKYGSHIDTFLSCQVSPPVVTSSVNSTNQDVDILDAVESRFISNASSVVETASLQTMAMIATVLNDDSDVANNSDIERLHRRENVRTAIVTSLANTTIQDIDTLTQVAEVTDTVSAVSSELTEEMEEESVKLYENLANSFKAVPKTFISSTRKTAKIILNVVSHSLTLQTIKGTKNDTTNVQSASSTTPTPVQQQQQQIQKQKMKTKNKKMLSAVENVIDTVTETVKVPQDPYEMKTDEVTLTVMRSEGLDVAEMQYSDSRQLASNQTFTVNFTLPDSDTLADAVPEIKNLTIFTQVLIMDENPYAWDDSYKNVTTPVMQLVIKNEDLSELNLHDLKYPVEIFLTTNRPEDGIKMFTLSLKVDPMTWKVVSRIGTTSIVKVSITHSSGDNLMIYLQPVDQNVTLSVFMSENENEVTPANVRLGGIPIPQNQSMTNDSETLFLDPEQSQYLLIVNTTTLTKGMFYLGVSVMDEQIMDIESNTTDEDLLSANITIAIGTFASSCRYYNTTEDKWMGESCRVSPFSSIDILQCWCNHLSVIAGGFFVLPHTIDPISDFRLFSTFFSNPVVVCAVLTIWFMYLVILIWARYQDAQDTTKAGVIVLDDNSASDQYLYLIGVVTGWWRRAGTTASVYICLEGQDNYSSSRLLADGASRHFSSGNEDWFLLSNPVNLGDMKSVSVWHDNSGKDPAWFLKQIIVQDLQTKNVWHFIYNNWLGVYAGQLAVKAKIPAFTPEKLVKQKLYQFALKSSQGLKNNHLWISIVCRSENVSFTRVQRLSCALSLLLNTMLTSLMFHGIPTDDPDDQMQTGVITFSLADVLIGIESGLIMFPINMIIMQLFTRLAPRPVLKQAPVDIRPMTSQQSIIPDTGNEIQVNGQTEDLRNSPVHIKNHGNTSPNGLLDSTYCKEDSPASYKTPGSEAKKAFRFPWWFVYIAWGLVLSSSLVSSYFVMLYGLKYGYQKSFDWLLSFFTAFFQSTCVTQPIKVFVVAVLLTILLKKPIEFEILTKSALDLGSDEEYVQKDLLEKQGIIMDEVAATTNMKKDMSKDALKNIKERLNLESQMNTIIRDIVIYFLYVAVILVMVHGHRNINLQYYTTKSIQDIFIHMSYDEESVPFCEVSTIGDIWDYLNSTLVPNLMTGSEEPATNGVSYMLGKARLRQNRQIGGTCDYPGSKKESVFTNHSCIDSFWMGIEETRYFNSSWLQPVKAQHIPGEPDHWTYQTAWHLQTIPYVGKLASYTGGGYVVELANDQAHTIQFLQQLQNDSWIDRFTASLFVEFTLYNPNIDLFSTVLLLFEIPNTGPVFPHFQIFTSKLYHYSNEVEIFIVVCEVIFVIVTFMLTYFEGKKFQNLKRRVYFSNPWSYIEVTIIGLSYSIIGLFFQRFVMVHVIITEYLFSNSKKFISFYIAIFWDFMLGYAMAALVMLVIIKVLKLFSFNKRTEMLSETLRFSWKSVLNFALIILIVIMAFSQFGVLIFGKHLSDYNNIGSTMLTLLHFVLGVADFFGLEEADRVFGLIFFFVFSLTVQYCLITMFIAIILYSFRQTRRKFMKTVDDKPVSYYLYNHVLLLLGISKKENRKYEYN